MMQFSLDGSSVHSNQLGVHQHLSATLQRHRGRPFLKPIATHNAQAFASVQRLIAQEPRPLVLDSGCGVGESTWLLAQRYPHAWVIGVDKSAHRLSDSRLAAGRAGLQQEIAPGLVRQDNCLWLRADLIDFWRLAVAAEWHLERHYMLYPNPWPKAEHLQRRWHGHGVFNSVLALGGAFELRSNWRIYLEEFAMALAIYDKPQSPIVVRSEQVAITPFERKYRERGEPTYRLQACLG